MTHLIKSINQIAGTGASLPRLACVKNPFVRGAMTDFEGFTLLIKEEKPVCKKCKKIYDKIIKSKI